MGDECIKCKHPCGTCEPGLLRSCLSCNQASRRKYLFGRTCLANCPLGTIANQTSMTCEGCQEGCQSCSNINNQICLSCSNNLALFNNTCLVSCPQDYQRTVDGKTCELIPYLLDGSLIYYPFGGSAILVIIICLMSYFATNFKSLVLSNSIAFLSIIEVGTLTFLLYLATLRSYIFIQVGALAILTLQYLFNFLFLIFYFCSLHNADSEFILWRRYHSFSLTMILVLSTLINFKLFRLTYSRFFGLQAFNAKIESYKKVLRHIQIFTIMNLMTVSASILSGGGIIIYTLTWGTQLYITVIEACLVTLLSSIFLIFELCRCCKCNDYQQLHYKKKYEVVDVNSAILDRREKEQEIKEFQLEIKNKQELLKGIIRTVKNNKDLKLNGMLLDDLMNQELGSYLQRNQDSMPDLKQYANKFHDQMEGRDERRTRSCPGSPVLQNIIPPSDLWLDTKHLKLSNQQKMQQVRRTIENMQSEFKYDNVIAESRPLPTEKNYVDIDIQAEIEGLYKTSSVKSSSSSLKNKRQLQSIEERQVQDAVDASDEQKIRKVQKKKGAQRRGKRNNEFYTQIDEEDEENNFTEDEEGSGQTQFKTVGNDGKSYLGVIVEDDGDVINIQEDQYLKRQQELEHQKLIDQHNAQLMKQPQSQLLEFEYFNQRTFNINDITGNFHFDKLGNILKKECTEGNDWRDQDGKVVNKMGYLIDSSTGDIINKNSFGVMFCQDQLIDGVEIPVVNRIEAYNFNPHEVLGNFDYDKKTQKPIILKNRQDQLVDKNLRNVNMSGFLVDDHGNVIDNQGRVRFVKELLNKKGDIAKLLNYKGRYFNIREIIGIFKKNHLTKEIVFEKNPKQKNALFDKQGRVVNQKGYLIDHFGNIINDKGKIVFRKNTLQFNEPPKFFFFTKFNIQWIMGNLNYNQYGSPMIFFSGQHGGLRDLDGKKVNEKGYLIDDEGNIVDKQGKVVFYRDILEKVENFIDERQFNKQIELPKVFRMGVLKGLASDLANQETMQNEDTLQKLDDQTLKERAQLIEQSQIDLQDAQQRSRGSQYFTSNNGQDVKGGVSFNSNNMHFDQQVALSDHTDQIQLIDKQEKSQDENHEDQIGQDKVYPSFQEGEINLAPNYHLENQDSEEEGQGLNNFQVKRKRIKTAKVMKPHSAINQQKPPKFKGKTRPASQYKNAKKTTTPFDYRQAANPNLYLNSGKSQEKLAKLVNSISSLNHTQNFQNSQDHIFKKQGTSQFGYSQDVHQNLKQIKKNPYFDSNEDNSNSRYGNIPFIKVCKIGKESHIRQPQSHKRIKSSIARYYDDGNQHHLVVPLDNEAEYDQYYKNQDEIISDDDGFTENFNIDKSSYKQYRGQGRYNNYSGSRLSSYSQESNSSRGLGNDLARTRKAKIGKLKQLEKIYLNKLEVNQKGSDSLLKKNYQYQKRLQQNQSTTGIRTPIQLVQPGYRRKNENLIDHVQEDQYQQDNEEDFIMGRYNQNAKSQLIFEGKRRASHIQSSNDDIQH